MRADEKDFFGYKGRLAFVNLTRKTVRLETADQVLYRDYLGGRGVQARLMSDHLEKNGPVRDPLGPDNRIIIGTGPLGDTAVPTSGRGSCTFIGTMTRSPAPAPWVRDHEPLYGLMTHSSTGGVFPNMLKRAGFDHVIIDGRSAEPVRIVIGEGCVEIRAAENDLFENGAGGRTVRRVSETTERLSGLHPGSSTICLGPAGWNKVAYAGLANDRHRHFGRGGAGAVFGSKNLVAITARGREAVRYRHPEKFRGLAREIDAAVKSRVGDSSRAVSFRPVEGTTFWLDRAFSGKYMGREGGYLPWHNYDEGSFNAADYAKVSTGAFLEIADRHNVCNRCRHVMCSRSARVDRPPYAGVGPRPEFETIALFINCCLLDRDAIFHLNLLCNELGVDTMTFAAVLAGSMDLCEKGFLREFENRPAFGNPEDAIRTLESIAYRADSLGILLGHPSDRVLAELSEILPSEKAEDIAYCLTTSFGGLGYAGIEPKAFPGMFLAYGTSNRGRGDHTYAWTIQAEEGGLEKDEEIAAYVIGEQRHKALVDSLGLCDFFTENPVSKIFRDLFQSLTGMNHSEESLKAIGRRVYGLERRSNNLQGRSRAYDAHVPAKLTVPLKVGAHRGQAVDPDRLNRLLNNYYDQNGWNRKGIVETGF